ncbi:C6 transcription factor [Blastomyces gilchristii SLH14081]|uniref:C6 transcription factor n=2 Tax=Blastomyces TaxID=229219 RepID=A0A179UIK1_BLAGS|nr:C6 transcription factor [Blastomyces gilchristii SLH14081]EGE79876.1 C6 transcription factor [Blastomyces dermatitidis ATCC 18188]OAT07059.1 C6 transcription factor [Blastomyces gilchristii SLH14081]
MSSKDSAAVAHAGSGKETNPQSHPHEAHESQEWRNSNNQTDTDTPPDAKSPDSDAMPPKAPPLQKRRRVTRACDECRRKKIKCDGKQPCTHCTVYSYDCTYDQPSNRRRNPAPQYIEALENRVQKAEAILRAVIPDLDINDPRFDTVGPEELVARIRDRLKISDRGDPEGQQLAGQEKGEESLLESMVDNTGLLDVDDQGHWDYHGQSSGLIFMRHLRKQFGNLPDPRPEDRPKTKFQNISHILEGTKSSSESPIDSHLSPLHDLPEKEVARKLCMNALEDGCCIMRLLHIPSFYVMLDRIYDTPPENFSNEENSFLPLLYLVLAVGCLFRGVGDSTLDKSGYESATDQGFQYFKAGRQLLDITECRDLTSLQTVCFMILFLQSSANISTCYSYIGIALRASLRLGLHRSVSANFNPIELETRKRVFWVVRKMDVHVSTILGLPSMLSEDDIDQEYPQAIDDEFITAEKILPIPPNHITLMAGVNAHIRLGRIVMKVVKYIYPVKVANQGANHTYMVSHSKIRELERDLQAWHEDLPDSFRPGGDAPPHIERMRQLLRIGYAHVQMVMYRPFLHYVTGNAQDRKIDKRSFACAAACVSVARNVVHITAGMKEKKLLNGSYWFTMYTTYFAVLSLLFFILENPESATVKDGILKDALEGKNALAGLAKNSMAADRCAQSLNSIFKHLPEKLQNRRNTPVPLNRKRAQPTPPPASKPRGTMTPPNVTTATPDTLIVQPPQRAKTFPVHLQASKQLGPARNQTLGTSVDDSHHIQPLRSWRANEQSPFGLPESTPKSSSANDEDMMRSSLTPSPSPISSSQQTFLSFHQLPSHQQQQQQQQQAHSLSSSSLKQDTSFSPPLDSMAYIPDLMPMMFPSDDPFAYPTQPMSTLENDHFKKESNIPGAQYGLRSSSSLTNSSTDPTSASTPRLDPFHSFQSFTNTNNTQDTSGGTASSLPRHLKQFPQLSTLGNQMTSASGSTSPGGLLQSPDLISMSDESFLWQDLESQHLSQQQHQQQHQLSQQHQPDNQSVRDHSMSGTPGFGMGMGVTGFGGLGMGMGMNMGVNLDDLLGNLSAGAGNDADGGVGAAGSDGNIEWSQWTDTGL